MKIVLVRKKYPECRGSAASWDEVQMEPSLDSVRNYT